MVVRVGGVKDAVFSKDDGGTLAVCGGRLAWIGGVKDVVFSKEVKEYRDIPRTMGYRSPCRL